MTKKTAWDWFSKYIRLRDCYRTTGTDEALRCYTCDKLIDFKDAQAGHGIGGRTNGILFDEEVVHGQCVRCNFYRKGNYEVYVPKLVAKHGAEWYQEKRRKASQAIKIDYAEQANHWRKKYKQLKENESWSF